MKTMERYTVYCTEEQTKKALELGAPIEICDCDVWIQDRCDAISVRGDILCHIPKITDYLYNDDGERIATNVLIKDTEEYGDMVVYAPTAEQMIGWLENQEAIREIDVNFGVHDMWYYNVWDVNKHDVGGDELFRSRKDASKSRAKNRRK